MSCLSKKLFQKLPVVADVRKRRKPARIANRSSKNRETVARVVSPAASFERSVNRSQFVRANFSGRGVRVPHKEYVGQ